MNTIRTLRIPLLTALTVGFFGPASVTAGRGGIDSILSQIVLPHGFQIRLFADSVRDARSLALGDDGTVYVGTRIAGKIYALRDQDGDGRAEQRYVLASGLTLPNGVAFLNGALYVAETHRLIRFKGIGSRLANPPEPEVVYDWFPKQLHHGWKYLRVGPDGKLYMPVGAPCNSCEPQKEIFATIVRMNPEGGDFEIYAYGVRFSVGIDWHPETHKFFFTDNGRDWLGDDVPLDELNYAPESELHFGYPYCHAGDLPDPELGRFERCADYTPPVWRFPAHVAPLGMRFYKGKQFPKEYHHQLFVAHHGSWNRAEPAGYQIVVVKFKGGQPDSEHPFARGWLRADRLVSGRPVDILELDDGSLLVSDDQKGVIYRISYTPN